MLAKLMLSYLNLRTKKLDLDFKLKPIQAYSFNGKKLYSKKFSRVIYLGCWSKNRLAPDLGTTH